MSLSKELVEHFQATYVNKNNEAIDYAEAEFQLGELADLIRLTSKAEARA